MYKRKTANAAELAEACRRAARMRKHNGGGRPRTHRKPSQSVRIDGDDFEVFKAFAADRKTSIISVMHIRAGMLVNGGTSKEHPDYAPTGWTF